jgi:NAD-dependent SIR2 family protein deacetylase
MLAGARALLVTAGAGLGVDSGLPHFRGDQGFWNAYPPYRKLGVSFIEMANPEAFAADPAFAWGFYGHRLMLYRETSPHAGFAIMRQFGEGLEGGCFVFTSNVDGHFQRSGFDASQIYECHGSLNHLQCMHDCGQSIWSADGVEVSVDIETMRATGGLPACPSCGGLARPNVLMFGDMGWDSRRSDEQDTRYQLWLQKWYGEGLVVFECGAGSAIPTVRLQSQMVASAGGRLIRVNPREPEIPAGVPGVSLSIGALAACQELLTPDGQSAAVG